MFIHFGSSSTFQTFFLSREALYESNDISKDACNWDSAALLASKVYYFLGKYDEAHSFALGAGNPFQVGRLLNNY